MRPDALDVLVNKYPRAPEQLCFDLSEKRTRSRPFALRVHVRHGVKLEIAETEHAQVGWILRCRERKQRHLHEPACAAPFYGHTVMPEQGCMDRASLALDSNGNGERLLERRRVTAEPRRERSGHLRHDT